MKISKTNAVAFFSELYENAKARYLPELLAFDRNLAQYGGDTAIDGSQERASTVRNITYELVEGEISSTIPAPRVSPAVYSEKNNRNAHAIEELCAMLRDLIPFEEINDRDERYTYIYGGSVFYVEWDENAVLAGKRGQAIVRCLAPRDFIPEPYITDVEEMEYCFLRRTTTREELLRRYGISRAAAEKTAPEAEEVALGDDSLVTEITAFYRDEDGHVGKFVWSGDTVLLDLPDYYRRRHYVCPRCGAQDGDCSCKEKPAESRLDGEHILHDLFLSDGRIIPKMTPLLDENGFLVEKNGENVMTETVLPYYLPEMFPIVIRRNVSKEGSLFGESDCAVIRPQQQALNKVESRIMQKLMRAGVTPVLPEDAEIALSNAVFGQAIRMKPGENKSAYGVIDTTPAIAQDIAEAERLYMQAKRILGISDSYVGISDATAVSGKAKEIQIAQASGRLDSKRRMKNAAYARIDRLLFSLYLAYADEPRAIPYRDVFGQAHNALFNRYDFLIFDENTGRYRYDDAFLFSADASGGVEQQREALWERNLENLVRGTLGDPSLPATLLRYWQAQEKAHYPGAGENVTYFRTLAESDGGLSLATTGTRKEMMA